MGKTKKIAEGIHGGMYNLAGEGFGNNVPSPADTVSELPRFRGEWDWGPCVISLGLLSSLLPLYALYDFFSVFILFIYNLVLRSPGCRPTFWSDTWLAFRTTELTYIMWSSNHPSHLVFLRLCRYLVTVWGQTESVRHCRQALPSLISSHLSCQLD